MTDEAPPIAKLVFGGEDFDRDSEGPKRFEEKRLIVKRKAIVRDIYTYRAEGCHTVTKMAIHVVIGFDVSRLTHRDDVAVDMALDLMCPGCRVAKVIVHVVLRLTYRD
ncbi:hypothetical protein B296_00002897 [Ensete ventricosum]|uniref:Uncharacterized protein n=1 Tax=Ensete ventricosum TaxID=4639 RepID=A0A427B2E8_ENSVE|nr:hypothetical protein B296_00002897 [Ensete ventricosum]